MIPPYLGVTSSFLLFDVFINFVCFQQMAHHYARSRVIAHSHGYECNTTDIVNRRKGHLTKGNLLRMAPKSTTY
uniref:Secreted protein n=1 Tax=Trichuris muris TaxID=70415 RepID=A0A5S6QDH8_TRIMR